MSKIFISKENEYNEQELEVDCEIESVWGEPEPIEQFNIEDTFEVETA